jgi:hypothetical protein
MAAYENRQAASHAAYIGSRLGLYSAICAARRAWVSVTAIRCMAVCELSERKPRADSPRDHVDGCVPGGRSGDISSPSQSKQLAYPGCCPLAASTVGGAPLSRHPAVAGAPFT